MMPRQSGISLDAVWSLLYATGPKRESAAAASWHLEQSQAFLCK